MCPTNHLATFGRADLMAEDDASQHRANAHFLIVDDIPSMRRVIGALLREQLRHIRISEAPDGKAALQLLKSGEAEGRPVDFVVTDWNMPNMDGISLLRSIREEALLQHLPVLLVTAEATRDMILAAAKAGADGYIVKPFNADTLKLKLQQIMAKRSRSKSPWLSSAHQQVA